MYVEVSVTDFPSNFKLINTAIEVWGFAFPSFQQSSAAMNKAFGIVVVCPATPINT